MTTTEFEREIAARLRALAEFAPDEPSQTPHPLVDDSATQAVATPPKTRWLAIAAAIVVLAGIAALLVRQPPRNDIAVVPAPSVDEPTSSVSMLFALPATLDGYQLIEYDDADIPMGDTGPIMVVGRESATGFADVSMVALVDGLSFGEAQADAVIGGRPVVVEDYAQPSANPAFGVPTDDGRWLEFHPARIELREALLDAATVTADEIVFTPFDDFEVLVRTDRIEETRGRVVSLGTAPPAESFVAIVSWTHPSSADSRRFLAVGDHERVEVRGREALLAHSIDPNGSESNVLTWLEAPGQAITVAASLDVDIVAVARGLRFVDEATWVAELDALEMHATAQLLEDDVVGDEPSATVPDGWQSVEIPAGSAALGEIVVWSGDEVLFWGGEDVTSPSVPAGEPGLAYDPDTGMWRSLAPSPKPAAVGASGVWTGDVMIVAGGTTSSGLRPSVEVAAYDPSTDTWTELADAPVTSEYASAVWTGTEMVLAGETGVAVYVPATDQWRLAAAPPHSLGRLREVAWTGTELIVWPTPVERAVHQGLALDLETDTWRVLPDPPAWPASPDIAWTGERLIIWGALPAPGADDSERGVGSMYDPSTDTWTELPDVLPEPAGCECNIGSQTTLWTGRELLVSTGALGSGLDSADPFQLLRFDPASNQWTRLEPSPLGYHAPALMADDRIIARSDTLLVSDPGWRPEGEPIP